MSAAVDPFDRLLEATDALIAAIPEAAAFAGGPIEVSGSAIPVPRRLPVVDLSPDITALSGPTTRAVAEAVLAVAGLADWQQTYSETEVGADYLRRYGWFNLVSPDGPFLHSAIRISFGVWGQGLHYPRHTHAPEELYVVIAGNALFETDGLPTERLFPGQTRHHASLVPHGMIMDAAPLLAFAIWKGAGLTRLARLTG